MDAVLKFALLYDFYGELLTEKQKNVFEYFHLNDYSLTEIAQELNISRQAVRDLLKRTETILEGYEQKLKLVEKFNMQKSMVREIKSLAENIESEDNDKSTINKIEKIKKIADEILD
ncbi:MAG: YlxM family DNA-binding protein [Clostridia bacterium]|jgi:predicted DNA-binding protein YlxM (UPF0122 family)|nr:YlxM family DNA-binding protein [Clostridia bacterium]MCI2001030.1 YlxM family DNA-binding protein [Clostridia bacterium]MCI2015629.1 YlxM family DNA-binding protein [Clostridia bacterium]